VSQDLQATLLSKNADFFDPKIGEFVKNPIFVDEKNGSKHRSQKHLRLSFFCVI